MGNVFLYNHGGSANHGCEALVRTICELIGDGKKIKLLSDSPQQDIHYDLQEVADVYPAITAYSKFSLDFLKSYICLKTTGDYFPMDTLPYLKSLKHLGKEDIEISIGGDNYCYEYYPKFIRLHKMICKQGCKSFLIGCSLERQLFDNPYFIEDMKSYDYISARESLTYGLLKEAGLTNIGYAPDSAFLLPADECPLPKGFQDHNTVGLNVSPLVIRKEKEEGIIYMNYVCMIRWILEHTDCAVALIPHVVWKDNDDRVVLKKLYQEFVDTGRVVMIEDCNCMQLKGYISRCRFFVGARTHATIAAYSSNIPTLVLGYSIKSHGIATDLFGTNENYVIPVQKLQEKDDLVKSLQWIIKNEDSIRAKMKTIIPEYKEMIKDGFLKVREFL